MNVIPSRFWALKSGRRAARAGSAMARLTVDLELEQVRAIVRDFDSTLDPVGFTRLYGGVSDVYRIDLAGAENPLILKIYGDEPAWIVASHAAPPSR